jgi:hypothetical protein
MRQPLGQRGEYAGDGLFSEEMAAAKNAPVRLTQSYLNNPNLTRNSTICFFSARRRFTMARSISVSTEVFAAIWARRIEGEEAENAILERLLGLSKAEQKTDPDAVPPTGAGVYDSRNQVHFEEGFEVVRTYKRREFSARASNGFWLRSDNGQRYATLNQLNASIAAGAENVWNGNWKYRGPDGTLRSIAELRS